MTYNPFNKPIHELTAADLDKLITDEVAEGYWIEYKSEFQSSKKIARSIASLANTYGGWYFIGVEADKTKNAATRACGFNSSDVSDPIAKIRDSIKSNIDPVPVFYTRLITLSGDLAVAVVFVPDNQETPFITKDGRIYRRVSDSSDPVHEDNRYAIDRLVDNGREIAKRFEEFCKDDRTFSQSEEGQGWVNVFLFPHPLGAVQRFDMLSTEGIEELIQLSQNSIKIFLDRSSEVGYGNLPLNSGQLGFGSVKLRQIESSKVGFNSLTVELFADGRAKFFIPLQYLPDLHQMPIENLRSPKVRQVLDNLRQSDKKFDTLVLRYFDIQHTIASVMNLLNFYQEFYSKEAGLTSLRVAITMNDVWRSVPFCDIDQWGTHVEKLGLPVLNSSAISIPSHASRKLVLNLDEDSPLWVTICPLIAMGFGLPHSMYGHIAFRPRDL